MKQFMFDRPTNVLFGVGQLSHLHEQNLPGKKALIITSNGSSTKKYGYLDRVINELKTAGIDYAVFDQIRPNPTRQNVTDGAAMAKKRSLRLCNCLGRWFCHGCHEMYRPHDDQPR